MRIGGQGLLLAVVSLVVAAAIAIGFLVLGSPQDARKHQLDRKRIEDLRSLSSALMERRRGFATDSLPPTLEAIPPPGAQPYGKGAGRDPVTGTPYGYRVLGKGRFELCATFDTKVGEDDLETWERGWAHPAGPHCFQFDATSGLPQPERITPAR